MSLWIYIFVTEQGEFLALDLGGSNFRVLLVKVMADGEQKVEMENQIYVIPEGLMRGSGTEVPQSALKALVQTSPWPPWSKVIVSQHQISPMCI